MQIRRKKRGGDTCCAGISFARNLEKKDYPQCKTNLQKLTFRASLAVFQPVFQGETL